MVMPAARMPSGSVSQREAGAQARIDVGLGVVAGVGARVGVGVGPAVGAVVGGAVGTGVGLGVGRASASESGPVRCSCQWAR